MTRPPGRTLSNPGRDSGVRRQTSPGSEDRELESDSAPLLGGASTSKRSTFRFRSSTEVGPFPPLNTGAQSPPCDGGRTGSPRPALRDLIPGFLTPSARPASGRRMPSSIPLSVRDFFANAWNYQQLSPDSETLFTYTPDERQSFRSRRGTAPMSIFRSEEMRWAASFNYSPSLSTRSTRLGAGLTRFSRSASSQPRAGLHPAGNRPGHFCRIGRMRDDSVQGFGFADDGIHETVRYRDQEARGNGEEDAWVFRQ